MPQVVYRANTASQHFPFLSIHHGRTVIVPKQDQAFKSNIIQNPADEDKDIGIPQAYYMHNVMPTNQGLQSIGFIKKLNGISGHTDFDNIFLLRDSSENKFLYSPSGGQNYIFDGDNNFWLSTLPLTIPSDAIVTVAYVGGNTYIFIKKLGIFQYDTVTKTLLPVTLIGVVPTLLNGICSSSGFLIAFDDFTVYRSQATSVLNFTPDPSLGSGSSIPEDVKGPIIACLPITNGFIIYTTKNAVGATFSQNIRYPFIYAEISGSSGILQPEHVSWQHNGDFHYAWTQAGLMKVTKSQAQLVFSDVTDFLTQKLFEDYDEVADVFILTKLISPIQIRLNVIERKFFVISYGISSFTHALVYDIGYKRWGKIKLLHVGAFEFYLPNRYGDVTWGM